MTPQIIEKLQAEINTKITKESQVVYLLAGIRKILEREGSSSGQYFYLKFHCDWALHAKLSRDPAQRILQRFNLAHMRLLEGKELEPNEEVEKISKMEMFREEISNFLKTHSITDFSESSSDWPRFLYLYGRIIEDVPLVISSNSSAEVREVVVSVETANEKVQNHQVFKVSWRIKGKDGKNGVMSVYHSFSTDM